VASAGQTLAKELPVDTTIKRGRRSGVMGACVAAVTANLMGMRRAAAAQHDVLEAIKHTRRRSSRSAARWTG